MVDFGSVRLEPGTHESPRDGVCLMELSSMVAGEQFSDRPRCVCRVIAAFLRGWNDRSSHAQRRRLRPYAKRVVGSRARRGLTHRRRDICLTWAGADLTGGWVSRALRRFAMRFRILALCGVRPALRLNEGAGEIAARVVFSRYDSQAGLDLVETLLRVGSEAASQGRTSAGEGDARARAIVERAVRQPVPLAIRSSTNGNGNGNGHSAPADREPEPVPAAQPSD